MKKFSCACIDPKNVLLRRDNPHLFFKTIHESVGKAVKVLEAVSQRSMALVTPGVRVQAKVPLRLHNLFPLPILLTFVSGKGLKDGDIPHSAQKLTLPTAAVL